MIAIKETEIQEPLAQEELECSVEKVDDVVLLIAHMEKMGLRQILDKHIPSHWKQRHLSWGWTAVIWLAYILSEGDHRKVKMEIYVRGVINTLSQITGQDIDPLDFSDDRLSHLLKHLSNKEIWDAVEQELSENSIDVFELPTSTVRCDATTVSGFREIVEDGLMQFGHSKDNPNLPQIKIMCGALDPLGMPLATEVVSGDKADDVLYIPIIERIKKTLKKKGLLFVSDCKGSALDTRAYIVRNGDNYLSPLPLIGNTAKEMENWITEGVVKDKENVLEKIYKQNEKGEDILIGSGYELERKIQIQEMQWTERVFIVKSLSYSEQQEKGLEKRLQTATEKIIELTPSRGRGKRQVTEEKDLLEKVEKIVTDHRVEGLLDVHYRREVELEEKYKGAGRGTAKRQKQIKEKVRYQITCVNRKEAEIGELKNRFSWKAFAANANKEQLPFLDAILCYRREYRIERIFNRLKSRLEIAPLYVKDDEQIRGMTNLLMLGVMVLTLLEFVVRRSLEKDKTGLPSLHPENKIKKATRPTAERLLTAFSGIYLNIIKLPGGKVIKKLTALSEVQKEILKRLELDNAYLQLST